MSLVQQDPKKEREQIEKDIRRHSHPEDSFQTAVNRAIADRDAREAERDRTKGKEDKAD